MPQRDRAGGDIRNPLRSRRFPEVLVDDFSRVDSTVEFYLRVNALLGADSTVVDLGAGRAEWFHDASSRTRLGLRDLRARAGRVIGLDVDPAVLDNPAVHEAHVIAADGPLPLADASADVVLCDWTFEHITQPAPFAAEIARVLRPGGWLCARTPHKWGYIGMGARLVPNGWHTRMLRRLQPQRHEVDVFPVRYRLNTRDDLKVAFPDGRWQRVVYGVTTEPVYAGRSRTLWHLERAAQVVQPGPTRPILHLFFRLREAPLSASL